MAVVTYKAIAVPSLIPPIDNTYDLGATVKRFRALYLAGRLGLGNLPDGTLAYFLRAGGAGVSPIYAALVAADIPNLDTAKITTGRFGLPRMPTSTSGYFLMAQGAGIDPTYAGLIASDIQAGRFVAARLLDGTSGYFLKAGGAGLDPAYAALAAADIPNLDVAKITTGRFIAARLLDGTSGYFLKAAGAGLDPAYALLAAADIPSLDVAKITTGRFGMPRMPAGTSGQVLTAQGAGVDPAYTVVSAALVSAGTLIQSLADTERSAALSWVKLKEVKVFLSGTLRIAFNLKTNNALYPAYAQIYRNGGVVGTYQSTSSLTYVAFTEDISGWTSGDLCQLYAGNTSGTEYINNFRIYIDSPRGAIVVVD